MPIAGVLIGLMVIVWAALPWLPIANDSNHQTQPNWPQFTIRTLLALTAGVAIVMIGLKKFPLAVSSSLAAVTFGYLIWFWWRNRQYRLQAASLLSCLCLPYLWIITYDELDNVNDVLMWVAGLPAILPAALISHYFGQRFSDAIWLAILMTAIELMIGMGMIRLGPRWAIAFLLLILLVSTFGSFCYHAAMLS